MNKNSSRSKLTSVAILPSIWLMPQPRPIFAAEFSALPNNLYSFLSPCLNASATPKKKSVLSLLLLTLLRRSYISMLIPSYKSGHKSLLVVAVCPCTVILPVLLLKSPPVQPLSSLAGIIIPFTPSLPVNPFPLPLRTPLRNLLRNLYMSL